MRKIPVLIFMTVVATSAASRAHAFTDAQLLEEGRSAYEQTKCVKAARYLFAYLIKNPSAPSKGSIDSAISWCEANTRVFGGTQGKVDGFGEAAGGAAPRPPQLDFGQAGGDPDKRCDIYARIAMAQNDSNLANGCNFPQGGRWETNYGVHYEWCTGAPSDQTRFETTERQKMLDQCAP